MLGSGSRLVWVVGLVLGAGLSGSVTAAQGAATAAKPASSETQQKGAGPDTTTATYGDWILRCQAVAGKPGQRTCEVSQSVVVQGQTAPIAQLAFGRMAPDEPLYVTVVVPTNITLPSTLRISIDEKDDKPVFLAWTRCLQTGCFSSLELTDAVLSRWRAQAGAGRLTFKNGAGQDTTLPISFNGLARALDALGKD